MMDYLKPVFEVGNINEDINLSLPPTSGEEYIKRVVIEARQCADVVVADINQSCVKPSRGCIKTLEGCIKAPPSLGPTLEWQQYQISDFSDIRLYVSQLKDEIQVGKRKWKPPNIHLPDINDKNAWISFCLSKKSILNILFCFNQATIQQVLEYLVHFVKNERRIEYKMGQWIYSLLAILEQPLQPGTCSCLRSLARACSVIRADSVKLINLNQSTRSLK